jgi:hypothetical protein
MLNIEYVQDAQRSIMLISIVADPLCAWCLKEQGLLTAENQQEGDSHGICPKHTKEEYDKYKASRLVRQ